MHFKAHLDVVTKGQYGQLQVLLGGGDGTLSDPTSYAFPMVRFVWPNFDRVTASMTTSWVGRS